MIFVRIAPVTFILALATSTPVAAEDLAKALDEIASFAERVCHTTPIQSSASELKLSGQANAELKGLVAKVAGLGVGSAAEYKSAKSEGVLQKDLAPLLLQSVGCQERVSGKLIDKLIKPESSTPAPTSAPAPPVAKPPPKTVSVDSAISWLEYGQFFVVTGGGPSAQINSVLFQGTSTTTPVTIKEAYAVSGLTGHKQSLVINVQNEGRYLPVDQVDIPPQAPVWLELIWNPPLSVTQFLEQWGRFSVTFVYNGTTYHREFDENFIREKLQNANAGGLGPHVTPRKPTA